MTGALTFTFRAFSRHFYPKRHTFVHVCLLCALCVCICVHKMFLYYILGRVDVRLKTFRIQEIYNEYPTNNSTTVSA